MKLSFSKRARDTYQRATKEVGEHDKALMRKGLADAGAKLKADIKAIEDERDPEGKGRFTQGVL
jgi:hypothetical protein